MSEDEYKNNPTIIAIEEIGRLEDEIQNTSKVVPEGLPYELWIIGKNKALEAMKLTRELLTLELM